jgi:hypothetical protein
MSMPYVVDFVCPIIFLWEVIARFVDIGGIVDHHMLSFIFHIDRHFLRNVYFSIYLQYVVPTFESNILFIKGALQMPD